MKLQWSMVGGDFDRFVKEQKARTAKAVTAGVSAAAEGLKTELRQQISSGMAGRRAPNMVGSWMHPRGKASMSAAGTVFARGERAEMILNAHAEGAVIKSRSGLWLAIPTEVVPKTASGGRGSTRPMMPGEVEQRFGRRLRFVYRKGRSALLVMDDVVGGRRVGSFRDATAQRRKSGRGLATAVFFVLVPQAKLRAKLTPVQLAAKWAAQVPALIERALPD